MPPLNPDDDPDGDPATADQVQAPPYRAEAPIGRGAGRYAPSPTSDLHLGNLRTGLLAWLFARSTDRDFLLRVEDLDQARVAAAPEVALRQLADLAALGLDHDRDIWWQSERNPVYAQAAGRLPTYECFCTRRDIAEASQAPHDDGYRPYPGTCRNLSEDERARRRRERPAALRVRVPSGTVCTVQDRLHGEFSGPVDDFVLRRNDGTWAYNLAVVVDDLASGVDQVIRGDDLLSSAPRQAWLAGQLGGKQPVYAHVPLVVNAEGRRLAKRDGAVTMRELGVDGGRMLGLLGGSLGIAAPGERVSAEVLLRRFDPDALPRTPWVVEPGLLTDRN
ncbi:tRNA glutamyl-Q(34) synthetase GluQRS [Naumannella halotolerans]|uniref:Glutamyl-Q tRNA(Asp) synthetase n=1 Tax=Naumannella halotolerans TaxID=993414 RepID=A0A4R7J6T9_9ACTN|nr:glutamyl-tRNA synthetase [Naumannella halotolerans]